MNSFKVLSIALVVCATLFTNCKKEAELLPENTTEMTAKKKSAAKPDGSVSSRTVAFTMPSENEPHEGTWLQWPHQYQYGYSYRNLLSPTWVAMTKELVSGENVHVIAYNNSHKNWIISKLNAAGVPLTNVNFKIIQTNDCWVRDNGPIFVRNTSGQLRIEDWDFNGWGFKAPYSKDNLVPSKVGTAINMPVVNLNSEMTVEGGAFEIDGNGTLMATRSSILNSNRNPGMTQAEAEEIFETN
ncbi:MAG: agmatine deiminase family protein, partial [Bacteroidota bacterium]